MDRRCLFLACLILAGCGGGGGGGKKPAVLRTADFVDVNLSGSVDLGDTLTLGFSRAVSIPPATVASTVFVLAGGSPTLGASIADPGTDSKTVVITLDGASLNPNGVHGANPASTGINVNATQTALTYGSKAVPSVAAPVDITGELAPSIAGVLFTDLSGDCRVGAGDTVEITFSSMVNVNAPPDQAFDVLPSVTDPFGTAPSYTTATLGVTSVTILLGANPGIEPDGTFDPGNPGSAGGPSGVDVIGTPGIVVDAVGTSIDAVPGSPPGVDVGGTSGNGVTLSTYVDVNANRILDAGDTVRVDFCAVVDVDPTATPDTAFDLPVTDDHFGTGPTFSTGTPPTGVTFVEIILGTRPRLTIHQAFDPAFTTPQSPSGVDVSSSGLVRNGGRASPVPMGVGVDIAGLAPTIGLWWSGGTMNQARYAHTATLLPNGEILIVGGMHDVASGTNPAFRECLDGIEVFDPVSGGFTTATDSLLRPRGYHRAVRTPGTDGIIDTDDDYVVIVGGWNSEWLENNGPHSEGAIEVIRPDWNEDGNTDDLVVNPTAAGASSATVPAEYGMITFGGIGPGGTDATVHYGMQDHGAQWAPDLQIGGAGNNEILVLGNHWTIQYNADTGGLTNYWIGPGGSGPPVCDDGRTWIAVDSDNDGDLFDGADGVEIGGASTGLPWTTPYSLTRAYYTQSRLAGPDGLEGTADDVQAVYGGLAYDYTGNCLGSGYKQCRTGDLETFDLVNGAVYTALNDAFTPCGLLCTGPGSGQTDRDSHVAIPIGGGSGEIVLAGGYFSYMAAAPCTQTLEILRVEFADPTASTSRYGGDDVIQFRLRNLGGERMDGSRNVIILGGYDWAAGATTPTAIYHHVRMGWSASVMDMVDDRDQFATVSVPANFAGLAIPEDRVYVFGGMSHLQDNGFVWDTAFPATTLAAVEYYTEW